MSEKRQKVVAMEPLPERATPAERVAMLDSDMREAFAKARQKANVHYLSKFSVNGWEIVDEETELGVAGRTAIVILTLTRGGAQ